MTERDSGENYEVREFRRLDRDQVVGLWREVFRHSFRHLLDGPQPSSFATHFDSVVAKRDRIWVVAVRGAIIAFLSASGGELYNLFVHPKYQRKGVGEAILHHALAELPDLALTRTLESNHAARAFYIRNGFAESHREPSPYFGEDYIVYRRAAQ